MKRKEESVSNIYFSWGFWIIFLLTIMMLLVFSSRIHAQREARQTAARSEMKAIAEAIKISDVDTGFYVTLRTLDDEPGAGSNLVGKMVNYKIHSEPIPFAINSDGSLNQSNNFPYSTWKGPYINYQSICTTGNANSLSEYGSPLDPWGNSYRFFTAKVLTNPAPGDPTQSPFSRNTLVSYGPDGVPGNAGKSPIGQGDDISYSF